jgi:hypothetical protein
MSGALVLYRTNLYGMHTGNFIATNKEEEAVQKWQKDEF